MAVASGPWAAGILGQLLVTLGVGAATVDALEEGLGETFRAGKRSWTGLDLRGPTAAGPANLGEAVGAGRG